MPIRLTKYIVAMRPTNNRPMTTMAMIAQGEIWKTRFTTTTRIYYCVYHKREEGKLGAHATKRGAAGAQLEFSSLRNAQTIKPTTVWTAVSSASTRYSFLPRVSGKNEYRDLSILRSAVVPHWLGSSLGQERAERAVTVRNLKGSPYLRNEGPFL